MAQLASYSHVNLHDLGSSPRSVQFLLLFSNADSNATLALRTTMFHPDQAIHASNTYRSMAKIQRAPYTTVNASYLIGEVNELPCLLGLIFGPTPPSGA